jgi:hypothetical protein
VDRVVPHTNGYDIVKAVLGQFPTRVQSWLLKIAGEFLVDILQLKTDNDEEKEKQNVAIAQKTFDDSTVVDFPEISTVIGLQLPILKPVAKGVATSHFFYCIEEDDLVSSTSKMISTVSEAIAQKIDSPKVQLVFLDLTLKDCDSLVLLVKTLQNRMSAELKPSVVFVVIALINCSCLKILFCN